MHFLINVKWTLFCKKKKNYILCYSIFYFYSLYVLILGVGIVNPWKEIILEQLKDLLKTTLKLYLLQLMLQVICLDLFWFHEIFIYIIIIYFFLQNFDFTKFLLTVEQSLGNVYNIKGYPTLKYFYKGKHPSEIRGLCLMKWPSEMLQKFSMFLEYENLWQLNCRKFCLPH